MDTSTTPSGIPYLAYLSGLNLGQGGQSGVTDPSLSGQTAGSAGGPLKGATGGLGLDELSQLLAAQQSADTASLGAGQSLLSGIGSLGGFGNLGQGAGGYYQAGGAQSGQQQQGGAGVGTGIAGQTGGTLDPMAVLRQALGIVQKGAGLIPNQPAAYGTAGDSGVSLSDQLRSGQAGVASPTVDQLGQSLLAANTLSDSLRDIPSGVATVGQPQILGYGSPDITLQSGAPGALPSGISQQQADIMQQMFSQGASPDQVVNALQAQGFSAGEIPGGGSIPSGGGSTLSGYQTGTPATSPTNIGGAVGSGAGAGVGLLNLIQGLQSGNTTQDISGALQSVGGIAGLLQNLPALANALGLSGSALSTIGAGAGGLGGLLGLAGGAQTLASGGSPTQAATQLGSGALGTYGGLSTLFPNTFPAISSALGLGADTAAATAAGTTGATAGAEGAGTVAAGTAGAGAAAGVLGVLAPVIVGLLGYMQQQEKLQSERFGAREFRDKTGAAFNQVGELGARLANVDPSQLSPDQQQAYFNAISQDFQTMDPWKLPATGGITVNTSPLQNAFAYLGAGANPSATDATGTTNQAAANQYGAGLLGAYPGLYERMAYMLSQNPNLQIPSMEIGGGRTQDIAQAEQAYGGTTPYQGWYGALPGLPSPYTTVNPDVAEISQGITQPRQVLNPALTGQFSPEVLNSPLFAQEYWQSQGVTPQEAFLYGAGNIGNGALGQLGLNLPGTNFSAYDPATLYQSLVAQGMPNLGGQQAQVQAMLQQAQGAPAVPMLPQPQGPLPGANPFPFVGGGFDPTTGNPLAAAYGLA